VINYSVANAGHLDARVNSTAVEGLLLYMDLPGYTTNNVHSGYPDASDAIISSAVSHLTISFQEGDSFTAYLRQLSKYALLRTGIVISGHLDARVNSTAVEGLLLYK